MKIRGLPFPVQIDGDVSSGGPASLHLELAAPLDDESFDQLRCVVVWFAKLAQLGAFGGTSVAPHAGLATLRSDEPDARALLPNWTFDALCVDPGALVSLANLAYATRHPITRFFLTAAGTSKAADRAADEYSGRWPSLPFRVEEGPSARTVELTIDFANDLDAAHVDPLCDALRVWSLVAALGGFREEGPLRDRPDLVPDDDPEITLDQLTFVFRDYGLNGAAYDALLNLLGGFAARRQAISLVSLI